MVFYRDCGLQMVFYRDYRLQMALYRNCGPRMAFYRDVETTGLRSRDSGPGWLSTESMELRSRDYGPQMSSAAYGMKQELVDLAVCCQTIREL